MNTNKLIETLKGLSEQDDSQSATARLRAIYPHVEAQIKRGVKHRVIIEALKTQGLVFTLQSFQSALFRIRHSKKGKPNVTPEQASRQTRKRRGVDTSEYIADIGDNPLFSELIDQQKDEEK